MKTKNIIILAALAFTFFQCKKEDVGDPLDSILKSGGVVEPVVETEEVTDSATSEYTDNGQKWKCTRKKVSITTGIGKGGFPMFNPNANVIYPGSLLQGKSLRNATPDVIAVDRAGGTVSYDIIDGNNTSSFTVGEVSKSSVTTAMNQIIGGSSGTIPANFSFSYSNIQSRSQFALEVDADYQNSFLELESHLELETDSRFNHYLVRLDQIYYTMSFDIPTKKSDIFAESVTAEELEKYVGNGNPATYVSDVSYGRIYYMLIESTSSVFDMEFAVRGSFQGIDQEGGASMEVDYLNELDELKIKVFAYGGESNGTLVTINDIDPSSLAGKLAEAGKIESGKPLSYIVRNVYDNRVVSMKVSTEYDVVNCIPVGTGNVPPAVTSHWSGITDFFGPIGAAVADGDDILLFNKDGSRYMISTGDKLDGPYELFDLTKNEAFPFDGVGAAGNMNYDQSWLNRRIYFNQNGSRYCSYSTDGTLQGVYNLGEGPLGTSPFAAQGVSAMANRDYYKNVVFNKSGDQFYERSQSLKTGAKFLYDYDLTSECPFTNIGAACTIKVGGKYLVVLFNSQGTQYCIADENGFTNVFDL